MPVRAEIVDAQVTFCPRSFLTPLRLSSGPIEEITEARATVRVRVGAREATGHGAIYLSDLWAWPHPSLPHQARDTGMRALCDTIGRHLPTWCGSEPAHPLELGARLHDSVAALPADGMPALARMVCASPFDAAVHDATGIALSRSAFRLYDEPARLPSVDDFFPGRDARSAIQRTLRSPVRELDAWLVVGVDEAVPERLIPWIRQRGYRCFKLKLAGQDPRVDSEQTAQLFHLATQLGTTRVRLAVDANCATPEAEVVLEYLLRLRSRCPDAFDALEYLEQPTARDITAAPQDWRPVNRLKPVVLDEGLTSLDSVAAAHHQGWGGIAVKTCKGHSLALTTAAWAHSHGMTLVAQDLTNPGLAAIHSALLAAHLPVTNGVEINSPQYTPAANADWLPRLAELFEPTNGRHRLPFPIPVGLGTVL